MGEASGEKDPYMQAYITARMKNQVEEMKLQKILSTMEVSQRVRKIMINLELFEDRKAAHKLQQEVMNVASRKRQGMSHLHQKASRHRRTANWTSSMMKSQPGALVTNSCSTVDLQQSSSFTEQCLGDRAVYPVTKAKDYGSGPDGRESLPDLASVSRGASAYAATRRQKTGQRTLSDNSMPLIQVTDCSGDSKPAAEEIVQEKEDPKTTTTEKLVPALTEDGITIAVAGNSTKTATIITPPPISGSHRASQPAIPRPATEPFCRSGAGTVHFPPVVRARSTRTRYTRSTTTARTQEDRKRPTSSSSLWPGDPRAICSVRRERRNIDEMLATMKAGQETRRLIRETKPSCSRNCGKPNIMVLLERTYVNLPDLLPEIEKARKRMTGKDTDEMDNNNTAEHSTLSSADKRRSVGRFDVGEEQEAGSQNLPVYQIDYNKLREMGGTRRNSVLV